MLGAVLALLLPTPYDLTRADTLLHQPPGVPAEPWPRGRAAVLTVMLRLGAVDPGGEGMWFPPSLRWQDELDGARDLVRAVHSCPARDDGDWLPDAGTCHTAAAAGRAHADRLRTRAVWEPDRQALLERAAAECDGLAAVWELLGAAGCPQGWQRPRRVVLGEVRSALGPRWDRREWPEAVVWWSLAAR